MEEYFKFYIKSQFQEEYWLLIVDSHASYISTEFIIFIWKHKTIYLYLLPY